jgi:cobyric acid synthase
MVLGTYLHGALDLPPFRRHFLSLAREPAVTSPSASRDIDAAVEESIADMSKAMSHHIDWSSLLPGPREGGA